MKALRNKIVMSFAWSLIRGGLTKSEALKMAWGVVRQQNALLSGTLKIKGSKGVALIEMGIEWPEEVYWKGPQIIGAVDDEMLATLIEAYSLILKHVIAYWTSRPGANIRNMALDTSDVILKDIESKVKSTQYNTAC